MDDQRGDEQKVTELIAAGSAQNSYRDYLERPVATSDNVIPDDICKQGHVSPGSTYREFFEIIFPD